VHGEERGALREQLPADAVRLKKASSLLSSRAYTCASERIWQWRSRSPGEPWLRKPCWTMRETHRDQTIEKRGMTCTMSLQRACRIVGAPEPDMPRRTS
jgi:hypothetical protein